MRNYNSLEGVIVFKPFASGSKSDSMQPYLFRESGDLIRIFFPSDNPYENETLKNYDGKKVFITGEPSSIGGVFLIDSIEEI